MNTQDALDILEHSDRASRWVSRCCPKECVDELAALRDKCENLEAEIMAAKYSLNKCAPENPDNLADTAAWMREQWLQLKEKNKSLETENENLRKVVEAADKLVVLFPCYVDVDGPNVIVDRKDFEALKQAIEEVG